MYIYTCVPKWRWGENIKIFINVSPYSLVHVCVCAFVRFIRASEQLRLLYGYPGPWRLFLVEEDTGKRDLLGTWETKTPPSNEEIERAVFEKKGKPNASDRVQASARFFQDGM